MIYLNMALGASHGWGTCGKNIARQLAKLEPLRLLSEPFVCYIRLEPRIT